MPGSRLSRSARDCELAQLGRALTRIRLDHQILKALLLTVGGLNPAYPEQSLSERRLSSATDASAQNTSPPDELEL
jgi:hypothetical protein